jgi:hypothetical protein
MRHCPLLLPLLLPPQRPSLLLLLLLLLRRLHRQLLLLPLLLLRLPALGTCLRGSLRLLGRLTGQHRPWAALVAAPAETHRNYAGLKSKPAN